MLYLDIKDRGTDSIADMGDIDVMEINSSGDMDEAYWWLKQNPGHYKSVCWDTATQMQQILIEEIGGKKAEKKKKAAGDWGVMTKQDWGEVSSKMKTWITNFRDLPGIKTVFIAQDRTFNITDDDDPEEDGIAPEVGPSLSPATMKHLCAAVSVIGQTFVRTRIIKSKMKGKPDKEVTEYCLRLGPSQSYITKFRKPKAIDLPDFLIDPTYEDILETIQGAN